jgi:hypothetical protein
MGLNVAEGEAFQAFKGMEAAEKGLLEPKPLPMQALDHVAGYFLAFGVNAALCKTIQVSIVDTGILRYTILITLIGRWVLGGSCFSRSCGPVGQIAWSPEPGRWLW